MIENVRKYRRIDNNASFSCIFWPFILFYLSVNNKLMTHFGEDLKSKQDNLTLFYLRLRFSLRWLINCQMFFFLSVPFFLTNTHRFIPSSFLLLLLIRCTKITHSPSVHSLWTPSSGTHLEAAEDPRSQQRSSQWCDEWPTSSGSIFTFLYTNIYQQLHEHFVFF